jgi:16S rRNA (cytosine967-C5)-methyltransferase
VIRNIEGIRYPDPEEDHAQYLSVVYSHPHWIVKRWLARFGFDETKSLLSANNERPDLSLRINRSKVEPGEFLRMLDMQKIQYTGSGHNDFFVHVRGLTRIGQMDLFRQGFFTIQDESAILPCLLLDPRPGERVIDMCAAPGGKTTAIGEMMHNEGEILAVDKYEAKLNLLSSSCERLGIRNVKLVAVDAATMDAEQADRVLLDAPCSGLGVLTKKPDIKWKRDISDILKLAELQHDLLENAARLVKPEGVLVYSTCTTEPEENQDQVQRMLQRHPEFVLEDARHYVASSLVTPEGYVETRRHRDGMDGSFAVRFRKRPHDNKAG